MEICVTFLFLFCEKPGGEVWISIVIKAQQSAKHHSQWSKLLSNKSFLWYGADGLMIGLDGLFQP